MLMKELLKHLYDRVTWPIQEKWIGTLQAAALVRSLYMTRALKKYISKNKKYDILDAGSGEGAPLTVVQARRFRKCNFVAVDLHQKYPSKIHLPIPPNIMFIKNDLFKYSTKNQYDIIICLDVLEHVNDYKKMLILFSEWGKPAGKLILHVPSLPQVRYFTKDKLPNSDKKQRLGDCHVREGFEFEKIQKEMENVGFKIIYTRYTFSPFTWFLKELFSIGERESFPGIGIVMLPLIWLSTKIEIFLKLRRGNGIFLVAEKMLKK
jgi:SAM-dependent methyltransferase